MASSDNEEKHAKDPAKDDLHKLLVELRNLKLDIRELTVLSLEDPSVRTALVDYTMMSHIPTEKGRELIGRAVVALPELDRAMGAVVGMAVGDAVGAPLEFLDVVDDNPDVFRGAPRFSLQHMDYTGTSNTMNRFMLRPGQWTDDAAMGLCMADSLLQHRKFDGGDMRIRFWNWWCCGYNNAFRNEAEGKRPRGRSSVGLGGNIGKSISALAPGKKPSPRFDRQNEDSGNGSLMRLAPVPVFFHNCELDVVRKFARESSYTTHPGPQAAEACAFLAHTIVRAIRLTTPAGRDDGLSAKKFLDLIAAEYLDLLEERRDDPGVKEMICLLQSAHPDDSTERNWNWKSSSLMITQTIRTRGSRYNGYPVTAGYFGSYCMDGLAMALYSVYHTSSFDEAVVRCVNFLGDADTTGAIAGQIAGAFYGISSINQKFFLNLYKWDHGDFALKSAMLYALGLEV